MSLTITKLVRDYASGDAAALESLAPIVYRQLRKMASRHFSRERKEHTLQPTAIVHEVFIKLLQTKTLRIESREHFFALASQMMRRILINHAETKNRLKRGGGAPAVTFDESLYREEAESGALLQLDEALKKLAVHHERKARVVELKYFGGMSVEEIAVILDCSPATVKRDWFFSRAWLHHEIQKSK